MTARTPPRGRSNLYEFLPVSGAAVTREFSRNQKSKRKIKIAFQNSFKVAKTAIFMAKPLKNAKNTPLRSVLIFEFNSNENQNLSKKSKNSKIRCNEDTKKQRFKAKEKNNENEGDLDDYTSNENDIRNDCRN